MDHYIWLKTKKFLLRLHPNKNWKWIINKYFPQYWDENHSNKWILTGPNNKMQLEQMAHIKIRRWNMIKYNYSPYDAFKSEYFKERTKKQFSRR